MSEAERMHIPRSFIRSWPATTSPRRAEVRRALDTIGRHIASLTAAAIIRRAA